MPTENHPSSLSGAFGQPFPEQVAFFRNKLGNLVPTQRWDDMIAQEHDRSFMVAGAMKADLLTDLAAAVDKAIAEGKGIDDFRKDFRSIVRRNGWTGWTGEGSVQGEAWRVKTILRTNSYTSYAAGRHAQLLQGNFAFWVYRHGDSQQPRLQHLGWDGLILEPGNVFWVTHYPPSDWGCSCYVVGARTMAGAIRLGGVASKSLPKDWNKRDPKTGEPAGIGKGWGYAPGASVSPTVQALAAKVRNWDYAVAKAFMAELPAASADALSQAYRALPSTSDDARRFAQAVADKREPLAAPRVRMLGLVPPSVSGRIEELAQVQLPGFDYRVTPDAVRHVLAAHGSAEVELPRGQRPVEPTDFARLPALLSSPDAITGPDRTEIGETLIHLARTIDGVRYTATLAINRRWRSLSLKTMFIGSGRGGGE